MALAWTATRDALTTAIASAANPDRAAAVAARDRLASLGARYDASIAAGTLAPIPSSPAAGVATAAALADQFTATRAALERATRYLESLPGVSSLTPFRSTDAFTPTGDVAPVDASLGWRRVGASTWEHFTGPTPNGTYAHFRVTSKVPGAEGNDVAARFTTYDGRTVLETTYGGRTVDYIDAGSSYGGSPSGPRSGALVTLQSSGFMPPPELLGGSPINLGGGSGGARQAIELRASLALAAARELLNRAEGAGAPTAAAREALTVAVGGVEGLRGALSTTASEAPAAPPMAVELALADALDDAARLLSYLAFS